MSIFPLIQITLVTPWWLWRGGRIPAGPYVTRDARVTAIEVAPPEVFWEAA